MKKKVYREKYRETDTITVDETQKQNRKIEKNETQVTKESDKKCGKQ